MIRRWWLRWVVGDAPADMGRTSVVDVADEPTVRECRADDLAVLTDEDLFALRSHVAWASHPHEATAAERGVA